MAHTDNIAEVVTGRFANTGDVGGHQGYTHRRKPRSLMQTARQRKQVGSSKQICEKRVHWGEREAEKQVAPARRVVTECRSVYGSSSSHMVVELSREPAGV